MSNVSWLRLWVLACLLHAACGWCGEVWTSDGRVTEGLIKIDNRGDFLVFSPSATATKVKADEAVYAWFGSLKGPGGFLPAVPLSPYAVGTPKAPTLALTGGVYTLKGGGEGIAGSADKCSFFAREINGNAQLVVRITEVGAANAQVGLSVRESTAPGARQITILVNPAGELRVRYRLETNGPLVEVPIDKARAAAENPPGKPHFPLQLKLVRKGRNFVWFRRKDERGGWWGPSGQIFADWQYEQWAGGDRKGPEPGIGMGSLALGGIVLASGAEAEAKAVVDDVRVRDALVDPLGLNPPDEQTDSSVSTRLENTTKGLWLRDGTFLVGASVTGMENDQVRFEDAGGAQATLSSAKLARANLTSLAPGMASNIPADGNGVLLASGEFMEGQFGAWKDGKITVSSIVFGLSTYKFPEEAKALAWHAPTAGAGRWIVCLRDGSLIAANSLRADQLDVLIDEPLMGQRRVAGKDIYAVRSSDHAVPLSILRAKIGTRTPDRDVIVGPCFEPAWSSWLTAGSRGAAFGVASPVGTEVTYEVPAGARRFVCWTGIPERIGSDLELRFVVLLDSMKVASVALPKGKDGRAIVPVSIPVSGKKTLTLRVDAEGKFPENRPPEGYGLWGDVLWLK